MGSWVNTKIVFIQKWNMLNIVNEIKSVETEVLHLR